MRVYVNAELGELKPRGIGRVVTALKQHLTGKHEITEDREKADHVVIHVIGYPETVALVDWCLREGRSYSIIQYCLLSTQEPNAMAWRSIWDGATAVWSYYDLNAALAAGGDGNPLKNFYHAPLGVDTKVFRRWEDREKYIVGTSGYVAESECFEEIAAAVAQVNTVDEQHKMLHVGGGWRPNYARVTHRENVSEDTLAQLISRCRYWAALRQGEGFELGVLEALACGTTPIVLDLPCYRQWFEGLALFIDPKRITEQLVAIFNGVTLKPKWQELKGKFDWATLITGFYEQAIPSPRVRVQAGRGKRKLLWLGDAAVPSGFAACTHGTIDNGLLKAWDVSVVGINYKGLPHKYPYDIYPAQTEPGDTPMGEVQLARQALKLSPDLIVIQQDPWNIPGYIKRLKQANVFGRIPVVGTIAVDGRNCRGEMLNDLSLGMFWTEFGRKEAQLGGFTGPSAVVPLGVDREIFKPLGLSKLDARKEFGVPENFREGFYIGYVGRNQLRKRLDLLIQYFANWVKQYGRDDAKLALHVAPTGDDAFDLEHLMKYHGMRKKLLFYGARPDDDPRNVALFLNCCDMFATASQAEGWCLPVLEAMACGVPTAFGDWAALNEWPDGAGIHVPCSSYATTPNRINSIGGIPDEEHFIKAFEQMYINAEHRKAFSDEGLALSTAYTWKQTGEKFAAVLEEFWQIQSRAGISITPEKEPVGVV